MADPADTIETDFAPKTARRDTLFVTDAEMIRRMGVPEKIAREAIQSLDLNDGRNSGFPQKSKFWGNRRYWPAVRAWLDHTLLPNFGPDRSRGAR